MNNVFISYAGPNHDVASALCSRINNLIGDIFYSELVEDMKQGDTTFTEKVISYFKICNVFIVVLTDEFLTNQFVNQEWGYARCLKEIGQIQLLLHIIQVDPSGKKIEPSGFISTNMDCIDLPYDSKGSPISKKTVLDTVEFLKSKESILIPIVPEKKQKLERFIEEIGRNISLAEDIISNRKNFETNLSINPLQFNYDYALQLLQIGHLFSKSFYREVENYIELLKELQVRKDNLNLWAVCRGTHHPGNLENFHEKLAIAKKAFISLKSSGIEKSGAI